MMEILVLGAFVVLIAAFYVLFKLGEGGKSGTAPAPSRQEPDKGTTTALSTDAKLQGNARRAAVLDRAVHATYQIAKALDDLDDYVTLQKEVQSATSELSRAIRGEQSLIKAALESAKQTVAFENELERDPLFRKHYEESRHEFDEIRRGINSKLNGIEGNRNATPSIPELPNFDFPPRHHIAKIADAIENKISLLKNERDIFLSEVVREIWANDKLRSKVEENLRKVGAFEIYKRLFLARVWESYVHFRGGILGGVKKAVEEDLRKPNAFERYAGVSYGPVINHQLQKVPVNSGATTQLSTTGAAIKNRAESLRIPFLVHFTKAENLGSIMEHGLGSLTALKDKSIRPLVNDHHRYDGHPDAICLSIAHPNDKMFFKYRQANPDQDWAVLVLDVSILWTHNVAFCQRNAADHRVRTRPLAQRKEASAFESMFLPLDDSPSRGEQNLEPFDPTDVQAELLIFNRLPPELINSVVFSSSRAAERYKDCVRGKPTAIDDGRGFLAARSSVRKSGWTYNAAGSPRAVQRQQCERGEKPLSALESGKIKLTDVPF